MVINKLEGEILYDGSGPYKKKVIIKKSPYPSFERMVTYFHKNLFELGRHFSVDSVIGNDGNKTLYSKDGFFMEWTYKRTLKNSGNHEKYNGTISIKNTSKLASMIIKRGYVMEIIIYHKEFADKIKEHKDMPLYKEITDILY